MMNNLENNNSDLYKILEVSSDASYDEIKEAYRQKAIKWHPDKYLNHEQEYVLNKFKSISDAFQILSHPDKRKMYDQSYKIKKDTHYGHWKNLKSAYEIFRQEFQTSNVFDIDEIDDSFDFKIRNTLKCNKFNKSAPIIIELKCSLEELYNEFEKEVRFSKYSYKEKRSIESLLKLNMKQNWKNGTKIIYSSIGNEEYGKIPGDVVIIIKEKKKSLFKRIGNNLYTTLDITNEEACNGFKKTIELPNKKSCAIEIDHLIKSNDEYKVIGNGLPIKNTDNTCGDLIIKFNISFNKTSNNSRNLNN